MTLFRGHCTRKHPNWQYNFIPTVEDVDKVSTTGCTHAQYTDGTEEDMDGTGEDMDATREDMDDTREDMDDAREGSTREDTDEVATFNDVSDTTVEAHDPDQASSNSTAMLSKEDVKTMLRKLQQSLFSL